MIIEILRSELSYNSGDMAHKFLPDDRKLSDYERKYLTLGYVFEECLE
jgi:hypothetical protein